MLETRTDEGAAKQFIHDTKLPMFFKPGNPFASRQGAYIMTPSEGKQSVTLQPPPLEAKVSQVLDTYVMKIFQRQISSALADLAKHPDNPFGLNNVGVAYLNSGDLNEAQAYFQKALAKAPQFLTARANLAKVYTFTNRIPDALHHYQELAKVQPNNTVVLMNMALLHVHEREFDRAKELLDQAIALDPSNAAAYNNRGLLFGFKGRISDGIADLRVALRINVRDAAVHNNLGVFYTLVNSPKKALRALEAALTLDPLAEAAIKNIAQLYLSQKRPDATIAPLSEYVRRHGEDLEARILLARAYFLTGKYELSIQQLNFALHIAEVKGLTREKADAMNNLGVVLRAQGQIDRAHEFFAQCLTMNPDNPVPFRNLAALLFDQGRFDTARETLKQCLSAFPGDSIALTLLGAYFAFREEYNVALEYIKQAILNDPKRALPYAWLTAILGEVKGDYQTAITRLEQGLHHNPNNLTILNDLAYSYLMQNDIRAARRILDRIDERNDNFLLTATRGLLLLKEGHLEEGRRHYNLAAKLAPTQPLRNLVIQKKSLELARYSWRSGYQGSVSLHLRHVLAIRT